MSWIVKPCLQVETFLLFQTHISLSSKSYIIVDIMGVESQMDQEKHDDDGKILKGYIETRDTLKMLLL